MNKARTIALFAAALLALLGLRSAIWKIHPHESGVLLRFGRIVRTLPAGMHFTLPWPADRVIRVPTTEVRRLRISAAWDGLPSYRDQWLTGDTNIVELRGNVQYSITDPLRYLFNLHGSLRGSDLSAAALQHKEANEMAGGDLEAAQLGRDRLVLQVVEAALTELAAGMTVDDALAAGKTALQLRGAQRAQALLDELDAGLSISALNIAEITAPPAVVQAFNEVTSARAYSEREITEAGSDAALRIPRERSKAARRVSDAENQARDLIARARGEAQSFSQLAEEVAKQPTSAWRQRWYESLRTILRRSEVRVVPPGSAERPTRVYVGD